MINNDINYSEIKKCIELPEIKKLNNKEILLNWIITFVCIILVILVLIRHYILFTYYHTLKLSKKLTLYIRNYYKNIILEIISISIHPFLYSNTNICYTFTNFFLKNSDANTYIEINNIFNILTFIQLLLKNYFIIRALFYFYKYNNDKSRRLYLYFFNKPSFLFGLKAMVKDNYFYFLFLIFSNIIIIGALLIQINEYTINKKLSKFFDCIWFITITITTVGYGYRIPKNIISQITTAFISLQGSFVFSFVIIIISNNLTLKIWEVIGTWIIKKIKIYFSLKKLKTKILKAILKFNIFQKRIKSKQIELSKIQKNRLKYLKLKYIGKLSYKINKKEIHYEQEKNRNYYSAEIDIEMKSIINRIKTLNTVMDKKLKEKKIKSDIIKNKKRWKNFNIKEIEMWNLNSKKN